MHGTYYSWKADSEFKLSGYVAHCIHCDRSAVAPVDNIIDNFANVPGLLKIRRKHMVMNLNLADLYSLWTQMVLLCSRPATLFGILVSGGLRGYDSG